MNQGIAERERLEAAVRAGIITQAQRDAIEALPAPPGTMRLSMVYVLWLCGAGLIVFALVLLAAEISRGDAWRLMWVCLVYTGALFSVDLVVQRRAGLRLLSSLLRSAMGVTAAFSVGAFLDDVWGPIDVGTPWSRYEGTWGPLIHGPYLPLLPVLGVSFVLIRHRAFLPAWLGVLAVVAIYAVDVFGGARLDEVAPDYVPWLLLTCGFLALGWRQDLNAKQNHGFWTNKAALTTFFLFTLSAAIKWSNHSDDTIVLLPTGIAMMLFSVYVRRTLGVSGGALALAIYVGDWFSAWDNLYVAAGLLALFGLGAIYVGVRAHLIEDRLEQFLPDNLRRLRPEAREDPVTFGF